MKVSRRVLARHIAEQLSSGADRKQVIESLAAYIVQYRLRGDVELIVADVAANLAKLGYVKTDVTTARPLDALLEREIIDYVKKLADTKQVEIVTHVDPSVLGGIIIETPSKRFDASVATRLKRLKNA